MKKLLFLLLGMTLLLQSCQKSVKEMVMPQASGTPYDLYIVAAPNLEFGTLKDTLTSIFAAPMEWTPNGDPHFRLRYLTTDNFKSSIIRIVGNVIYLNFDAGNAQTPTIKIERDTYATSQIIIKMYAQSPDALASYIPQFADQLRDLLVKTEHNRAIQILDKEFCRAQVDRLIEMQEVSMKIPQELNTPGIGKDSTFFWCTNNAFKKRCDIVVYSIPYTDANVFTLEGAVAVRDSVMKANIESDGVNSYMTTNRKYVLPEYQALNVGGKYIGELKGMWRIENGLMAGPFICHIRLDALNRRVVFAEGFVYAPDDEKRNSIRRLEAALYTLRLPSDNIIPEIEFFEEPL